MQRPKLLLDVENLTNQSLALWSSAESFLPELGRSFNQAEQSTREQTFDRFMALIEAETRRLPRTAAQRQSALRRISSAFAELAQTALDLDDSCLTLLLDDGFSGIGTKLARRAREFDPQISPTDIMQACRNAWTACGLQSLFGRPMSLNPALFAYSLLYPYSDNFMDEGGATRDQKLAFSNRFRRRLSGEHLTVTDPREAAVYQLVSRIEMQYPRSEFHALFDSLLAIHRAQEASLAQLRPPRPLPDDYLVRLTFQKGGTSVLADAYLGAGHLEAHEVEFAFLWGVFLQLADDLQDLEDDLAQGSQTLFSGIAGKQSLDVLACRVLQFGSQIAFLMDKLPAGPPPLKRLLRASSVSLIIRAAGCLPGCYSESFLGQLEPYSPFRFSFLRERQALYGRRKTNISLLFEALLASKAEESIFPSLSRELVMR